jgi:hypothetical protein
MKELVDVSNRVVSRWLSMITPADISECKTVRQARRWFYISGVLTAKRAKNRQELRETLIDALLGPRMSHDAPLANVIRWYLNDQDTKPDRTTTSDKLYRALYAENISQEDYEKTLRLYLQRERSRRK